MTTRDENDENSTSKETLKYICLNLKG